MSHRQSSTTSQRLPQTIGAAPLFHPESPREAILSVDEVLFEISKTIGIPIELPNPFPNEFGLRTRAGVLAYKVPMALYQADRLKRLSRLVNGNKVLEIGPGMGRTAFYAYKMGIDYTTVDLPMGIVAQACFLAPALGEDLIWMPGDPVKYAKGRIRLLSPADLRDECFSVALNANSLTEMSREQATLFFQQVSRFCKAFLSINHEVNSFTVKDIAQTCEGYETALRSVVTIRSGYVEELFLFPTTSKISKLMSKYGVAPSFSFQ